MEQICGRSGSKNGGNRVDDGFSGAVGTGDDPEIPDDLMVCGRSAGRGSAAAFLYAGMEGQLMCFVTVSFLLLLAVRPAALLAGRADRGGRRSKGRMHGVTTGLE